MVAEKCYKVVCNDRKNGFYLRLGDYVVSIQFGVSSFSDQGLTTAEIAVVSGEGLIIETLRPRVTPQQLVRVLVLVAAAENTEALVDTLAEYWGGEDR